MIYSFSGSIPRNTTNSADRLTLACFDWFCKVTGSFIDLFVYQFESHGSLQSFQQQEFNLTSCPGSGEGVGVCEGEEDAESEARSPEGILTSSIQLLEIKHSATPPLPVSLAISDQQPAWPTPPYIFTSLTCFVRVKQQCSSFPFPWSLLVCCWLQFNYRAFSHITQP